ncbi:YciI family protein [Albidovulum sp.]|uniref:YciI family protein n=1 Tax=Albidovulum sp. TaxID=1872424 RepID=UPI0039B87E82
MLYTLTAFDKPGEEARANRARLRLQHMDNLYRLHQAGQLLDGGAYVDDAGNMNGSILLLSFADEAELQAYRHSEVFIDDVWGEVTLTPFRRIDWDKFLAARG